jgi:CBS domain-containing protein
MRVSERCRHVLVTTVAEETLLGAATRMSWYRIGALPVYRRHRLIGIVTERDIIAALADGADPATTKVAQYMTDKPVAIRPDEDLEVAARRMAELGVRHLPVLDGDRLLGVLSIRDLLAPAATPAAAG